LHTTHTIYTPQCICCIPPLLCRCVDSSTHIFTQKGYIYHYIPTLVFAQRIVVTFALPPSFGLSLNVIGFIVFGGHRFAVLPVPAAPSIYSDNIIWHYLPFRAGDARARSVPRQRDRTSFTNSWDSAQPLLLVMSVSVSFYISSNTRSLVRPAHYCEPFWK